MIEWNFRNVGVTALVLVSMLLISLRVYVPARMNGVYVSNADMDVWILAGQSNMVGTNGKVPVWTHASLHDTRRTRMCMTHAAHGHGVEELFNLTGRSTHAPSRPAMAGQDYDVQCFRPLDRRNPQRSPRDPQLV